MCTGVEVVEGDPEGSYEWSPAEPLDHSHPFDCAAAAAAAAASTGCVSFSHMCARSHLNTLHYYAVRTRTPGQPWCIIFYVNVCSCFSSARKIKYATWRTSVRDEKILWWNADDYRSPDTLLFYILLIFRRSRHAPKSVLGVMTIILYYYDHNNHHVHMSPWSWF